jgi:hypothetical protein
MCGLLGEAVATLDPKRLAMRALDLTWSPSDTNAYRWTPGAVVIPREIEDVVKPHALARR